MTVFMLDENGQFAGQYSENPNREGWTETTEPAWLAVSRLNNDFTNAMKILQGDWPSYEVATWTTQAAEAKEWHAAEEGSKPLTPFLTTLHEVRGTLGWTEEFSTLIDKVLFNNDLYTKAAANHVAVRHFAEREILAATDAGTVTWTFGGVAKEQVADTSLNTPNS